MQTRTMTVLAVTSLGMVLLALAGLFFVAIPPSNKEAVSLVIGSLLTNFGMVIAYYYGSSRGSVSKDAAIEHLAATNSALTPTPAGQTVALAPGEQATVRAEGEA